MTEPTLIRARSVPDQIRYFSRELIKRAGDDLELGGFAIALGMAANRANDVIAAERKRADAAETDRARIANALCVALWLLDSTPGLSEAARAEVLEIRNGTHGHDCAAVEQALGLADVDPDEAGAPA